MADLATVAAALLTRCSTLSVGSPTLTISYPDVPFTPPTSGKYLDVALFYNRPAWEGLSEGKLDQGLLQITVVWPEGQGVIKPAQIADAVRAHFPKGLRMGPAKVSGEPWAASPILDAASTRLPVTIPWTAS